MKHYALASEHYCHFTSPIRRYPDLTIHRLFDAYLSGTLEESGTKTELPEQEELAALGTLLSTNERRAEAAERELKLVLILRLLERCVGDELDGIVTGVANVGVFVQLERYLVDGLLRFDDLPDDWWEVDVSHGCVIGQRSGRRITIGDRFKVAITRVHVPTRQMGLALARRLPGAEAPRRGKSARAPLTKKRTSRHQTRPKRRTPTCRP